MIDEQSSKNQNIAKLKVAFAVGMYGNSEQVMKGTAGEVLEAKEKELLGSAEKAAGSSGKRKRDETDGKPKGGPMDAFVKRGKT